MSPLILQAVIIASLIIAIFLGSKYNKNIGILSIALAYLISTVFMRKSLVEFLEYWPLSLTFAQIGISYFFGFANKNETMMILAQYFLYPFRKAPKLIPIGLFLVSALLCAMGASTIAVVVLMATIAVSISEKSNLDPLLASLAVVMGCPAGNSVPWGDAGLLLRGYIDTFYSGSVAEQYSIRLSIVIFCTLFILFLFMYFIYKGYKCTFTDFKKPDKFNRKQKITLVILVAVLSVVMIPQIINKFVPNDICLFLTKYFDIRALAFIGGSVCALLNLADEKEVIASMPWNTIVMIAGISMLIEMGAESGMMDTLSSILSINIPMWGLLCILTLIGALLSVFGNSILVVGIMIPVAETLMRVYSISSPFPFLAAATLGAYASDAAPFSTGGALILSSFKNEDDRRSLFVRFTRNVFLIIGLVSVMSMLGWTRLF